VCMRVLVCVCAEMKNQQGASLSRYCNILCVVSACDILRFERRKEFSAVAAAFVCQKSTLSFSKRIH